MVYRNIEETLNLVGMQIHGDDSVGSGGDKQVAHQLCGD